MAVQVITFAFDGVEPKVVDVQIQLTGGIAGIVIVGLPDKTVAEAKERIRAAFASLGLGLPSKRIIVNLAPADLPKEGSHYDLAIALGLLAAMGVIEAEKLAQCAAIGELSLNGALAETAGILPAAMTAESMSLQLICPESSGSEAAWAGGDIIAPKNLMQLINHFKGAQLLSPPVKGERAPKRQLPDLADVRGQAIAKRALEISAAGGHNLLLCGPPGAGKSMLAARLPSLLPPLSPKELLEVSQIQSIAGMLSRGQLSEERSFRAPHHSASMPALIGGGTRALPGEVSLAHHGVLFLDELPEFSNQALEALRQPLESGEAVIARANRHVKYPARFIWVSAMNPCKCGGGPAEADCSLKPRCKAKYRGRLSGPLLDRIDLLSMYCLLHPRN